MSTLSDPGLAPWQDFLAGVLSTHEAGELLDEPEMWAVPGLGTHLIGSKAATAQPCVVIVAAARFESWLGHCRPYLLPGYEAARALRTLEGMR